MSILRRMTAPFLVLLIAAPVAAHHLRFTADLSGAAETPPNASPGLGHVVVAVDFDLVVMEIEAEFSGLLGTVTSAHIHAATAEAGTGEANIATQMPTFADFPAGVTSGTYLHEFNLADAATYNPAFISATGGTISTAMNVLLNALEAGKAYFDIHTTAFDNGEIRGFLSHVPGDYNLNGVVDAADYVVWRSTLGDVGDGLVADANQSSVIDVGDYTIWRAHFGESGHHHDEARGSIAVATVPEPRPSLVWAVIAIGWPQLRRRGIQSSGSAYHRPR